MTRVALFGPKGFGPALLVPEGRLARRRGAVRVGVGVRAGSGGVASGGGRSPRRRVLDLAAVATRHPGPDRLQLLGRHDGELDVDAADAGQRLRPPS